VRRVLEGVGTSRTRRALFLKTVTEGGREGPRQGGNVQITPIRVISSNKPKTSPASPNSQVSKWVKHLAAETEGQRLVEYLLRKEAEAKAA
jgi:hypothetical protein